jgi:hypothetical protein
MVACWALLGHAREKRGGWQTRLTQVCCRVSAHGHKRKEKVLVFTNLFYIFKTPLIQIQI